MTGTASPTKPTEVDDAKESEPAKEKRKRRVEFVAAIIIAIAATLTAIATYQGSEVDGRVEDNNTAAVALIVEANGWYNDANAQRLVERDWIFSFISEEANGAPAADIMLAAMPDEVYYLALEWREANEPAFADPVNELIDDPFAGTYVAADDLLSEALLIAGDESYALAECALFEASVAGIEGDNYGLATVALAIALVVAGIAALLNGKAAQIIVIVTAALSLVAGASFLAIAGSEEDTRAVAAAEFFLNDDQTEIAVDDTGVPIDVPGALRIAAAACP